jgi:N-acetylgalactosamine-6-sulfatase
MGLGISLFSGAAAKADSPEGAHSRKPNILFIYADDWGWGDLSCHGNKWLSTPSLDRLASQGTEFYQFNVNNPVCSPSRTAAITGRYPARYSVHQHFSAVEAHVAMGMPDWLDPQAPMLPRILKQAGYVTGHFGKWHLSNTRVTDAPLPAEYGIDEYAGFNGPGAQIKVNDTCAKAIDFIKRHKDESFFINLWVHEPHTPHYPSEESLKRFSSLDKQRQVYAAVIADGDRRIGEVLETLKQLNLENDTLVVFASDNGPEITGKPIPGKEQVNLARGGLGEYYSVGTTEGLRGRKRSLYEGGVRVPFMVRWPGKVPVGKINETIEITAVDLLPTFCAVAGVKLPEGYMPDGENMLRAFLGEPAVRTKPIFWEWQGTHAGDNWPCLGVRQAQWKLLMSDDKSRVELYDIPADRLESKNLATQRPEVVKELVAMVETWKAELPPTAPTNCFSRIRAAK